MITTTKTLMLVTLMTLTLSIAQCTTHAADPWRIGFGKVDITPTEPVRLSGYATRDKGHVDVADKLYARACVLTNGSDDKSTMVLVSIDSIAIVAEMTKHVTEQIFEKHGLPRSQVVLSSTHSHAAPHVANGLTNLYRTPLSEEELNALKRNTERIEKGILEAVDQALAARRPGSLQMGFSKADFAVNRRVLVGGIWSKFGIQADGPVDRRVRVLQAIDADGKLMGAATMYACHCTTLGPDFNNVSGDWAGLASSELEKQHAGAVFLSVIGCGADANPEPRRNYDDAKNHAAEMVSAITAALKGEQKKLTAFPEGHFGYAGLAPELPTRADLQAQTEDKDVVRRRWATSMLQTWDKMGRLPETYPAPIHTWKFGDALTWVFLGGEVVVDYQIRLQREIPSEEVWVAAYTDDVFAYVASERMRAEGGYEVDFSMLYYNQPGRWQSGTEELISKRVQEILKEKVAEDKPRDPLSAKQSIHVPSGYIVDLMAAEPAVSDPINMAFGHDGKVWVVEMSDYPLGSENGGRVKWLQDKDGDGQFETAATFLDKLNYPTSVTPWRDGVIVIAAPDVLFAADRDGDGVADHREVLLTGVGEANPQHRASGFEIGLDGLLNFASGDSTRELKSHRNGQVLNVTGRDVVWNPDTGEMRTTSGHTQYIRARDEFGNWFGNVNNQPMFHYVIEDAYRSRGSASGQPMQHLLTPAVAPPVYPASRTTDRFNDLFTYNRFTSACSSIICRVPGLGESMRGSALVCEPVHNLVARFHVEPSGASFRGSRFKEDEKVDFFASADSWSRPVRAVNSPDGTIWVADMVRLVIEHPQWIPMAWQERLNVRAGAGLGRVFRVHLDSFKPTPLPNLTSANEAQLLSWIASDNGALRDLAAQQIIWRGTASKSGELSSGVADKLRALADSHRDPAVRCQALGCLFGLKAVVAPDIIHRLADSDPRVRRWVVSASEAHMHLREDVLSAVEKLAKDEKDLGVRCQLALSLGGVELESVSPAIEHLASESLSDPWIVRAMGLVVPANVDAALAGVVKALSSVDAKSDAVAIAEGESTFGKLWPRASVVRKQQILEATFANASASDSLTSQQIMLLSAIGSQAELKKLTDISPASKSKADAALELARRIMLDEKQPADQRANAARLLILDARAEQEVLSDLQKLLGPTQPPAVQQAAIGLARKLQPVATADALVAAWPNLTADVRASIAGVLLDKRNWSGKLLGALESGAIKVSDLDAATIQRLRSYGDRSFMARSEKVLGQPTNADRAKLVSEMLVKFTKSRNAERGTELFKQHCAVCHRATESRALVGPPLENLKGWNETQWLTAILDPNRAIEPKYHQYIVLTTAGQTLSGLIEDRTATSITLAAADGVRHELQLSDIENMKDSGSSLMPEGLETKLSPQDLADLIEYAKTLAGEGSRNGGQ